MSDDINTDAPASEQFDLTAGMEFDATPEDIHAAVELLEQVEDFNATDASDEELAEFAAACKRLEDAVETARKDVFEAELTERVEAGDSVGELRKQTGRNTWVADTEGAFAAVAESGSDPMDVAKVSISSLRDVLGDDADEFIGSSEYEYFRRTA